MPKLTLEEYQKSRDAAIDEIFVFAQKQKQALEIGAISSNNSDVATTLIKKISDNKSFEERKELYKHIFDKFFYQKNQSGELELIQPTVGKKRCILFASTHSDVKRKFQDELLRGNAFFPAPLKRLFNKVNNGHAILLDHDKVREVLPDYQVNLRKGYLYPGHSTYAEVKIILRAMSKLARNYGYNIIDFSSSHTVEKNDQEIDALRNFLLDGKEKDTYQLISIGLVGDVDVFSRYPQKHDKNASLDYIKNLTQRGLKWMAHENSFPHLMRVSDSAMLLWDNGEKENPKYRYSVVATAKNGKMTFLRRDLWRKFDSFKDMRNVITDMRSFYPSFYKDILGEKNSTAQTWEEKVAQRSKELVVNGLE